MKGSDGIEGRQKPELVFSDLRQGVSFRPLHYPVDAKLVALYMETVGDRHPLYAELAPPGLAAIYSRLSYLQDHSMPSGGVLAKQEFEFMGPIRIGDVLTVTARVKESRIDEKGRRRVAFEIHARNQQAGEVSITRLHAIWPR